MKIVSYNVNGIRAAINKGLEEWLKAEAPDIVCFQEIKANEEDIPKKKLEALGYTSHWFSAEKKGYSGVGILSKKPLKNVKTGMGDAFFDGEGRTIIAEVEDFVLINTYFPSGSSSDQRQDLKMQFLDKYNIFIQSQLKKNKRLIVVGDYNIAHEEIDIHNPVSNKNSSGFLPEERAWMTQWFDMGMIDSYRELHPTEIDQYSWWTYRANARANNKGWRIDYISISNEMKSRLREAKIHNDAFHSDHCPISIILT